MYKHKYNENSTSVHFFTLNDCNRFAADLDYTLKLGLVGWHECVYSPRRGPWFVPKWSDGRRAFLRAPHPSPSPRIPDLCQRPSTVRTSFYAWFMFQNKTKFTSSPDSDSSFPGCDILKQDGTVNKENVFRLIVWRSTCEKSLICRLLGFKIFLASIVDGLYQNSLPVKFSNAQHQGSCKFTLETSYYRHA